MIVNNEQLQENLHEILNDILESHKNAVHNSHIQSISRLKKASILVLNTILTLNQ